MKVIYINDVGGVAVFHPNPAALLQMDIVEIAKRVVPKGKPFKVITGNDLPEDRRFRESWEVDEADLTDGIGELE